MLITVPIVTNVTTVPIVTNVTTVRTVTNVTTVRIVTNVTTVQLLYFSQPTKLDPIPSQPPSQWYQFPVPVTSGRCVASTYELYPPIHA